MLYERYVRRLDREAREKGREEGLAEGRTEGRTEGRAEVLALLDEDTRKDAERKLQRNGDSETRP